MINHNYGQDHMGLIYEFVLAYQHMQEKYWLDCVIDRITEYSFILDLILLLMLFNSTIYSSLYSSELCWEDGIFDMILHVSLKLHSFLLFHFKFDTSTFL